MCLCGPINSIPAPINHESLTVSTLVVALDPLVYKTYPATAGQQVVIMAFITNFGAALRYWTDGTAPTASVGHVLADGDSITICAASIPKFKVIRKDSTDSILSVTYLQAS